MNNVICIPFAYERGMNTGVNLKHTDLQLELYMKNAMVAMVSAKRYNPDCTVLLATNLTGEELPQFVISGADRFGYEIKTIPFDRFRFRADYKWSLAFYKLCVLSYLAEEDYDHCCYMDTDVITQDSFESIWTECDEHILMYDINHGLNTTEYAEIVDEFRRFYKSDTCLPTHYGGEFFAAGCSLMKKFLSVAQAVYGEMIESGFETQKGDEFIISVAADRLPGLIKNASPYICRFWTGANFRLVSTCYNTNAVTVLHLPAEKERGIVTVYERYVRKGKFPDKTKIWKLCRLSRRPILDKLYDVVRKVIR